ncbi:hypothetical protein WR25_00583 [Diploscapter pachys]|uniref:C-type lectin domain-containing protein n=1 Tax=Diploscapter pachys TaxID=2018661 RepID=A0A2A2JJT1_9BILA|nr:hypothetical protein WR25_00583 [Diploscapter pachys]
MYKKCYEFYQEPAQFAYAEQQCNGEHGHLVSIASAFENSLVNVNAEVSFPNGTKNYWIGINDLLKPGTWTWISGSNATYDDWAPTQPRQGSDCGMVQISEGQWYSADCMIFLPYVCEVPVIYPPTCPPQSTPPHIARTGEKQDPKERLTWIGLQWSPLESQQIYLLTPALRPHQIERIMKSSLNTNGMNHGTM